MFKVLIKEGGAAKSISSEAFKTYLKLQLLKAQLLSSVYNAQPGPFSSTARHRII
jgi:hypothetical protein